MQARALFHSFDGYDPPEYLTRMFEMLDSVTAQAYSTPILDYRELAKSPATAGKKVADHMRLLAANVATRNEVETGLDKFVAAEARGAIKAEADRMLDALRPRFDAAVETIIAARVHGLSNATDPAQIIELGDDAVTAWRALRPAAQQLDGIAGRAAAIAVAGGYPNRTHSHDLREIQASRFLTRIDPAAILVLGGIPPQGPGGIWLDIAHAGLRLNTVAEADALLGSTLGAYEAELGMQYMDVSTASNLPAHIRGD